MLIGLPQQRVSCLPPRGRGTAQRWRECPKIEHSASIQRHSPSQLTLTAPSRRGPGIILFRLLSKVDKHNVKYRCRDMKYAQGHVVVSLRDDSNDKKWSSAFCRTPFLHPYFRRKYFTGEAYFTWRKPYFTNLHRKFISLSVGHIPMPNRPMGAVSVRGCRARSRLRRAARWWRPRGRNRPPAPVRPGQST